MLCYGTPFPSLLLYTYRLAEKYCAALEEPSRLLNSLGKDYELGGSRAMETGRVIQDINVCGGWLSKKTIEI